MNGWGLFSLISIPISIMVIVTMMQSDLSVSENVAHMISYSVRFAIPLIFIVAASSSYHTLFPSVFSKWWLKNRKYIGLSFAVAMAWQGLFIFILSTFNREYYFTEVYLFRDELEGSIGYIFLLAMVITSFKFGRKYLNGDQWTLIQKGGVYFLWAYAFSVYWWNLFYYPLKEPFTDPRALDYIFYWMGFSAFVLRIAAWGKKRKLSALKLNPQASYSTLNKMFGYFLIGCGLLASATGLYWQKAVNSFLLDTGWSAEFELWFPFWPFGPFLPLIIIGIGTLFLTRIDNEKEGLKELHNA